MNAVVLSSAVGGISALIGAVMNHFFSSKRSKKSSIDEKFTDIDEKFTELFALISALDTKFTGQISALDRKVTGQISALETKVTGEIKDLELSLTDKFVGHLTDLRKEVHEGFKAHGERLARIETKLEIEPSAEAA